MNYAALLSGKTAVVTSGAHGMGRYIAEVFARHGAKVIVNGLAENGAETGEYLNEISPGSYFLRCDMSSEAEVENFTSEVLSREEAVDIAVNNVGINHYELFEYVTEYKFFRAQRVNIGGTIQITRAFLPGMARRGVGAFVHISTVHSVAAIPGNATYASSKAAINAFSCAVAEGFAESGVRSNVICPGGIFTGRGYNHINEKLSEEERLKISSYSTDDFSPDYTPGSVYDIANAALFLVSPMARGINGEIVMVDGGNVLQSHIIEEFKKPPESKIIWREYLLNLFEPPPF